MFKLIIDKKIEMRLLELRHADEVFSLADKNREYLREWLPWLDVTKEVKDTENFIKSELGKLGKSNGMSVGIWYEGNFAGIISLISINKGNKSTEIGYWLGEEFNGKGIMTKACKAMLDYSFGELKLNRVEIRAAEENYKSQAIPKRLNFTKEGTLRDAGYLYGEYVSLEVYGMLAYEWKK